MSKPVRLRVTITYEYDADPEHYEADTPEQMAALDQENFDPDYLYTHCEDPSYSLVIAPVKD